MTGEMQLKGRAAIITGAASGIGRALAHALARRGCHLALADVNMAGLEETAQRAATGVRITRHSLDVGDAQAIAAFPDLVRAEHGRVIFSSTMPASRSAALLSKSMRPSLIGCSQSTFSARCG